MCGEQDKKQDGERVEEKTDHVVISLLGLVDDFTSVSTHMQGAHGLYIYVPVSAVPIRFNTQAIPATTHGLFVSKTF